MIQPIQQHKQEKNHFELWIQEMEKVTECYIGQVSLMQMYLLAKILFLFLVWDNHRDFSYFLMLPNIDLLNFIQNFREILYISYEGKPLILELFYFELQNSFTLQEAIQYRYFTITWFIFFSYLGSIIYGIFFLQINYIADKTQNLMIIFITINSLNLIFKFVSSICYYYEKYRQNKQNVKYKLQKFVNCSICLGEYYQGEELRQLVCKGKHIFHQKCFEQWFKFQNKCPNCRQKQ
ncbi:hypothetical protein pb186bvf_001166 [Paramecium bursaria]